MNEVKKGRVFVVQKTMRWDKDKGELIPKFDLTPAEQHGRIEYLLSPTASPFRPESLMDELHEKLRTITEDDCLLLVGSPVLIGMAVAIAADYTDGNVRVLQWNGKQGEYVAINIQNLFYA